MRSVLLALVIFALPAAAQQRETAAPLPAEARGPVLDLSFALSRQGFGGAELLRFSDLSARLATPGASVDERQLSSYVEATVRLAEAGLESANPAPEIVSALRQVRDALSPRLSLEDTRRLEEAGDRLEEKGSSAVMKRARDIGKALAQDKPTSEQSAAVAAEPSPAAASASQRTPAALRPAIEWWTVGERRYDTTRQLARDYSRWLDRPAKAIYHFQLSSTLSRKRGFAIQGVLSATEDLFGNMVFFTPDGSKGAPVDLAEHARAAVSAPPAAERRQLDWLRGAGYMLVAMGASLIPLFLGDFAASAAAAYEHDELGKRIGRPGLAFGAGVAILALAQSGLVSWAMLMSGDTEAAAAVIAGLALLIGALWGHFVLPRARAARAANEAEKDQWWAKTNKLL